MNETVSYDKNGNIGSLSRDGGAAGTYHTTGNQLMSITGGPLATATSYVYDANGNMTTDGRQSRTVSYNYLNLPVTVSGSPGISNTYDATGMKLKKAGTVTPYYASVVIPRHTIPAEVQRSRW